MAAQLNINASIVNILKDKPKVNDTFLVDTNVWFWMTYSNATICHYQKYYPSYLNQALSANAHIHYCGLSLAELAHLIEKIEREIFEKMQNCKIPSKEYRHNFLPQHIKVVSELEASWNQVKSMATPISISIDEVTTDAALQRFKNEKVDGYDLFILESMKKHGIKNIITDDGDFATTPGITVFTANKNVIITAQQQKKLISR